MPQAPAPNHIHPVARVLSYEAVLKALSLCPFIFKFLIALKCFTPQGAQKAKKKKRKKLGKNICHFLPHGWISPSPIHIP